MRKKFFIFGMATVGIIILLNELFYAKYDCIDDTMPRAWWNGGK